MNTVRITEIGRNKVKIDAVFTVRGRNKGAKAKPAKCAECGDEIAVGEQYFRIDNYWHVCLGCAKYS